MDAGPPTGALALNRTRALVVAHLGAWRAADPPVTVLLVHALAAGVLCGLVRGMLPPFAYALFAFLLSAALLVLPFLGELGFLMREDPAREWSGALPATAREQRLARALAVAVVLGVLALGSLLPAAALAPSGMAWFERALLVPLGLASALTLGGVLLVVQRLLAGRAGLLSLLHALLFAGLIGGLAVALPEVRHLAAYGSLSELPVYARLAPPAWFAAPLADDAGVVAWASALAGVALGALLLAFAPLPLANAARGTDPLGALLAPLRRLAVRSWVRRDERATFELVFDALPHERETSLRTRPLLALPLLFLVAAFGREPGPERDALLSLLLFVTGCYLPVLAAHVPASASHRARWLLDGAPAPRHAIASGAFKAVAVRALVPLYALLFLVTGALGGWRLALTLTPLGALFALAVLRRTWRSTARGLPLSVPPDEAGEGLNLGGPLLTAAILATVLAVVAVKLATPVSLVVVALALVTHEILAARLWRRAEPATADLAVPRARD